MRSQPSKADAEQRADRFKEKYKRRLKDLKENPWCDTDVFLTFERNCPVTFVNFRSSCRNKRSLSDFAVHTGR